MSLFLIRHGETALNVARILQPANTPLSPRGFAQAKALATRLVGSGVTAIVSSDLPRALQTAEQIALATRTPIEPSALLQERNFGRWRGQNYDHMAVDVLAMEGAPPEGESGPEFRQRVAEAFELLVHRHSLLPPGHLAVVSHGLVIRELLGIFAQGGSKVDPAAHIGNTSLSIIEPCAPHAVTLLNCTRHLDQTTGEARHALSGG